MRDMFMDGWDWTASVAMLMLLMILLMLLVQYLQTNKAWRLLEHCSGKAGAGMRWRCRR